MKSTILITGGAGYIASHCVVELIEAGYDVIILDNLCNSCDQVLKRLEIICGRSILFIRADARDRAVLDQIFCTQPVSAVMHFAGLKAVGESVVKPVDYFDNNLNSMLTVVQAMQAAGVRRFVFSSSATVYGNAQSVPINEEFPLQVTNPYGRSKLMCEQILCDLMVAEPDWQISILRYFNPVGAHESGLIGEAPHGIPNNLMPFITQVAVGKREKLSVFGNDYPTFDGTCVRDYIHVVDLALGHVSALRYMELTSQSVTVNLGRGIGTSVLEMLQAFQRVTGKSITYEYVGRRSGDIAICYADASLAKKILGWEAKRGLDAMCRDAWRWQSMNPDGY